MSLLSSVEAIHGTLTLRAGESATVNQDVSSGVDLVFSGDDNIRIDRTFVHAGSGGSGGMVIPTSNYDAIHFVVIENLEGTSSLTITYTDLNTGAATIHCSAGDWVCFCNVDPDNDMTLTQQGVITNPNGAYVLIVGTLA